MAMIRFDKIARECRSTHKGDTAGIPIVGLEHIEPGEMLLHAYDVDVETTFTKTFKKGQVLFGRRRAYQHKACVATCSGICSGDITVIEPIEGAVDPDLLPFIIHNDSFFDHAIKGSNGALSPRVKWEHMANYELNLPPLSKQKLLAEKLWAAYKVKQSYIKMIEATDEMVKSQFIEMFGKEKANGTIADLIDKGIKSVKKTYDADETIEYIDISSVDSSTHVITETTQHVVSKAPSRAQQCVEKGDILVSTVRPVNRNIAVVNSDLPNLVASTGFCVLRPKDGFREYILSVVQSDPYTEKMCDKASGGLYPAVNNGDVLSYDIYIPSESMLKKVTSIYQQADKSKIELLKSIEAIDKVIKSLINENLYK